MEGEGRARSPGDIYHSNHGGLVNGEVYVMVGRVLGMARARGSYDGSGDECALESVALHKIGFLRFMLLAKAGTKHARHPAPVGSKRKRSESSCLPEVRGILDLLQQAEEGGYFLLCSKLAE